MLHIVAGFATSCDMGTLKPPREDLLSSRRVWGDVPLRHASTDSLLRYASKHIEGDGNMDETANLIPLLSISVALDLVQWLLGWATSLYRLSQFNNFPSDMKGVSQQCRPWICLTEGCPVVIQRHKVLPIRCCAFAKRSAEVVERGLGTP